MSQLAPPPAPPRVGLGDDDRHRRLRMRLTQLMATTVTVLTTAWVCTFGAIPAIIALMIAKHVLVAVAMMGSGLAAPQERPGLP
jgi:hypothetical protein